MKVLSYILGLAGVYTSLWMYEVKYVWMNEADSVFSNEGSLVEVPYVEPSFLGSLDVKSMIQSFMAYEQMIWKIMCYVWDIICCVQYDTYDDACYSHCMTFLIQIWQVH